MLPVIQDKQQTVIYSKLSFTRNCHFERREKSAFSFPLRKADFSPDEAGFEMTGKIGVANTGLALQFSNPSQTP